MADNYLGTLTFNDTGKKFQFQEDAIRQLTAENDVAIGTMGSDNQYLSIAVARPGELDKDVFEKGSDSKDIACVKTNYKKMDPRRLFDYTNQLLAMFNFNKATHKDQAFYNADNSGIYREVTKDEFYKT